MADRRSGRAVRLVVLLFVLAGVANGVFSPFGPAILASRGFSATWIGILAAIVSVAYIGLAGVWGHVADVVLGRGRALAMAIVVAVALLAVFTLPMPIAAVGMAYIAFSTVYGLVFPLQDALAVNGLPDPARQYGFVRAVMSGTFAIAAMAAGAAFGEIGYAGAMPLFALFAIPAALVGLRLRDAPRARLPGRRRGGAVREALAVAPRLRLALLAIGLANVGVFAALTFLPLLITRLGGAPGDIGLAVGITAVVEVVMLPISSRLLGRFGPRPVVSCGVAGMSVVFVWFALASTPAHVIVAAVLYGFAWSAMWAGSVTTVRVMLPPELQGSGQSLLSLTTAGIAAFVANVGGGLLWAGPGPVAVFGIAAGCAAAGSAVAWSTLPDREDPVASLASGA